MSPPKLPLQQLAARVLGQAVGEHHAFRAFEVRHVLVAMRRHFFFGQRLPGLDHDHRGHRLHPFRVGQADHGHLAHRGQAVDHFLHLAAGHVFAAGLDHVFLAVHDGDETFAVDHGQVAAVEPVALEAGRRALGVVEVAEHQVRGAVHDLADLAHGHVLHGVVDHAGFHVEHGLATRAGFAELVVRPEHGGQRCDFGLAVQVPQPYGRQARGQFL
ncbi:hypothetical protein Y695_03488 [Hydrogenophaga sp. T4]|nr:hypothetical protein Y695_03488 [Hydrogenophaga sp. T4]